MKPYHQRLSTLLRRSAILLRVIVLTEGHEFRGHVTVLK